MAALARARSDARLAFMASDTTLVFQFKGGRPEQGGFEGGGTPFRRDELIAYLRDFACATVGALLPFTPAAPWLGFTPLPPLFFAVLLGMVVAYLGLVEVVKRWFYRRYPM